MKRSVRLTALAAALTLAVTGLAAAAPQGSDSTQSYLVNFRNSYSASSLAIAGVTVDQAWEELGAAVVTANAAGLKGLQTNPQIALVEKNRTVKALSLPYTDTTSYTWGLDAVNAPEAWTAGATGAGIKVCVLDTGIDYNHPEFFKNGVSIVKDSRNFVLDGHKDATDGAGHGTHTAGTIAAQLTNPAKGVAPNVELYIGRVLGDDGFGTTQGVINGVNWCADSVKANIISLSLGSDEGSKTEEKAFDRAWAKGALSIAASGNDDHNPVGYPAAYGSVVAVGAVDQNLQLASFSNMGPEQELVAPGTATLSSVPLGSGRVTALTEAGDAYVSNSAEFAPAGNVTGPLVECGIADSTTSCTGAPASGPWIALINRGVISFGAKVTNVMAQGASAAIIANRQAAEAGPDDVGNFTLGAPGNWIPTVSVSYNSGVAIRANGLETANVTIIATDYDYLQGTSMATPHVSGVAALAWSMNPALTNRDVRAILQQSAMDLGDAGRDTTFGYGLVQADAAAALAATWDSSAKNPGRGTGK
ncbi:MAG TPA: S8 family serine peptidase [Symbiobacteriaceae bacterium]|nr:S8 family serine peptidase [Symbiobacteriaceae bacterium]